MYRICPSGISQPVLNWLASARRLQTLNLSTFPARPLATAGRLIRALGRPLRSTAPNNRIVNVHWLRGSYWRLGWIQGWSGCLRITCNDFTLVLTSIVFFFSLSWHTLLERCRVHHWSPGLPVGCLLPCRRKASNPPQLHVHVARCIGGSSFRSLPVRRRLLDIALWLCSRRNLEFRNLMKSDSVHWMR